MKFTTKFGNLHISDQLTAKMEGINSLSTLPSSNVCNKICKIPCYAKNTIKMYKKLKNTLEVNTEILTKNLLKNEDLPFLNNSFFRLESFGELHNEIQLKNYLTLINKNSHVSFTLWTKNFKLTEKFFDENKKPKNLILIYSSIKLNSPLKIENFKHCNKIFTVYEKDFINNEKIKINCMKKCIECMKCYSKNNIKYINETKK